MLEQEKIDYNTLINYKGFTRRDSDDECRDLSIRCNDCGKSFEGMGTALYSLDDYNNRESTVYVCNKCAVHYGTCDDCDVLMAEGILDYAPLPLKDKAKVEVSISNNLITMILKLVAGRDTNGNPRGVYVGLDSQLKIRAAWDVGYHGKAIIPDEFKNKLTDIEIRTSGKDYNEIARGKMTGKCLSIALEPYDSFEGKSFNGKAGISTYDGSSFTLDSCEMSIMRFSKDRGFERMSLKWDKTIARHINSFRRSFGKLDKFTYEDFIALQMV